MRTIEAITFDVYGTLVRFHEVVETALTQIIGENDLTVDMQALRSAWRATQGPLQQARPWRPYKEIIALGLQQAFAEMGLAYRPAYGVRLAAAIPTAGPFDEVPEVLAQIKQNARIVFISNTDNDMIAGNMALMPIKPDVLVTAEDSQYYKPAHEMFAFAMARADVNPARVVHVAAGFHHDIEPAHALGIRRVWVNRRGESGNPAFAPYDEIEELSALPSLLEL